MGFYFTVAEPQKVSQGKLIFTQKTASREIFCYPIKSSPKNRLEAPELRQKNRLISTRNASGIPYWPSRDPIGERGGVNLYGFLANNVIDEFDPLGLEAFVRQILVCRGVVVWTCENPDSGEQCHHSKKFQAHGSGGNFNTPENGPAAEKQVRSALQEGVSEFEPKCSDKCCNVLSRRENILIGCKVQAEVFYPESEEERMA